MGFMVDNHTLTLGLHPCTRVIIDQNPWLPCYNYNINRAAELVAYGTSSQLFLNCLQISLVVLVVWVQLYCL